MLVKWTLNYIKQIYLKEWGIVLLNLRFAEYYNSYTTDKDNFRYYKLKYAYNFGEFERNAFKFQEIEDYKNNGNFGSHFKKYDRRIPDYPVL